MRNFANFFVCKWIFQNYFGKKQLQTGRRLLILECCCWISDNWVRFVSEFLGCTNWTKNTKKIAQFSFPPIKFLPLHLSHFLSRTLWRAKETEWKKKQSKAIEYSWLMRAAIVYQWSGNSRPNKRKDSNVWGCTLAWKNDAKEKRTSPLIIIFFSNKTNNPKSFLKYFLLQIFTLIIFIYYFASLPHFPNGPLFSTPCWARGSRLLLPSPLDTGNFHWALRRQN